MIRVGLGYDVHRLEAGRRLVLGGVEIPFELGLLGHSDADVLLHAVIDALLGAAKLGDIGRLFPDDCDDFKDISSLELLTRVSDIIYKHGWRVENVDCVLCLNAPKIAPFAAEMEYNIANILRVEPERVSVKGKTEEGLGVTGTGLGVSAQVVCLLERTKPIMRML